MQWQAVQAQTDTRGEVVFIATATAHDAQMRQRIARHQADRAVRLPLSVTLEEPLELASAIDSVHAAQANDGVPRFVVVDCLTLWLTNWLMPAADLLPSAVSEAVASANAKSAEHGLQQRLPDYLAAREKLLQTLERSPCPVVLVSNEVGLGISPLGADVRDFVDELGMLNQAVARVCSTVVLCAAGVPWTVKSAAGSAPDAPLAGAV